MKMNHNEYFFCGLGVSCLMLIIFRVALFGESNGGRGYDC